MRNKKEMMQEIDKEYDSACKKLLMYGYGLEVLIDIRDVLVSLKEEQELCNKEIK